MNEQVRSTIWRPIVNAPRDGTKILVSFLGELVIAWNDDDYWEDDFRRMNGGEPINPTHWMPLPDPWQPLPGPPQ